ncbi:S8 family serine peptidase [Candidatus Poribacteria bacterium]|nr:S8 family serine peptidase [Candidatus Poribacteria bacterium]
MRNCILKTSILIIALLLAMPVIAFGADQSGSLYAPGKVLVKFKSLPSARALKDFALSHNLVKDKRIPRIDVFRFSISNAENVPDAVKKVAADRLVEFAEPDYIRYANYLPNDPLYSQQWDMTRVELPLFWDVQKGVQSVIVAVTDTGIDLDHPDLVNQLWQNPGEIPGNNIDDDHNGYRDDYNGYDFAGDGVFPLEGAEDPIPDDTYVGHGTHVSGTIAAQQDNSIGISGEAPGVKIMAVRVLGGILGAGFSSDIAEGVIYATDNGASVINMSLGGTMKTMTEYNSLKYAWDNNVFIAAAAGNEGDTGNPIGYPAAYCFTTSVGATDSLDNIASFSTHNVFVEVSGPGVEILSTVPGGVYESSGWSGTSMATPHVAGLAALLYSQYPGIANWQVRSMLQSGVIDRGAAGWDAFYGYGRVDCSTLLAVPLPSANTLQILSPPQGSTFPSGSLVALLWTKVAGAASYKVHAWIPGGGYKVITTTTPYYTVPPSQRLAAGSYTIKVEAYDGVGGLITYGVVGFNK